MSATFTSTNLPVWIASVLFFLFQTIVLICFSETMYNGFGMFAQQICVTIFSVSLLFYAVYYNQYLLRKYTEQKIIDERESIADRNTKTFDELGKRIENLEKQPIEISQPKLDHLRTSIEALAEKNITAKQFEEWIKVLEKLQVKKDPPL